MLGCSVYDSVDQGEKQVEMSWTVSGWRNQHTLFSLFREQGLDWGWGGGFKCQSGHGADITLLHSPYVLIVSRSWTNLDESLTSTPVEKVLQTYRWETQKQDKRNRQGHKLTGICLTDIECELDTHTNRQSLLRETDRQTAGRLHWLFPRLHKQLQLWN